MFKWFKSILSKEGKGLTEQLEAVHHTKPEATTEGVSEPVITFVRYVKSNPRNFSISVEHDSERFFRYENLKGRPDIYRTHILRDKKLGDSWSISTSERAFMIRMVRFEDDRCASRQFEEKIDTVSNLNFELTLSER